MSDKVRVMIVDDHEHAREAMRVIVGSDPLFEIVAEASSGGEALELAEKYMPDLILMDIHLPGMDGLETTKKMKEKFPYVKIVMVTVSDDITHLFEALKKGAQGYLLKNLSPESWNEYLRAIASDETPMSRELANRILQEFSVKAKIHLPESSSPLTSRERTILELVAMGKSNREISQQLGISEYTVKNHLKNIMQKLHLENRVQLTRFAYEQGYMENYKKTDKE